MFYGDSFVTIDTKGRTAIPAKFREELGDKFFLMRGFDLCVSVYPAERFEKLKESFLQMKTSDEAYRIMSRRILGSVQEVECDAQGRLSISPTLREFARFKKEIHVLGTGDHIELWDKDEYERYYESYCTGDTFAEASKSLDF